MESSPTTTVRHKIERVRHETKRRTLTVASVEDLSPCMRRIIFIAPELADFTSAAPDDHIKLFSPLIPPT